MSRPKAPVKLSELTDKIVDFIESSKHRVNPYVRHFENFEPLPKPLYTELVKTALIDHMTGIMYLASKGLSQAETIEALKKHYTDVITKGREEDADEYAGRVLYDYTISEFLLPEATLASLKEQLEIIDNKLDEVKEGSKSEERLQRQQEELEAEQSSVQEELDELLSIAGRAYCREGDLVGELAERCAQEEATSVSIALGMFVTPRNLMLTVDPIELNDRVLRLPEKILEPLQSTDQYQPTLAQYKKCYEAILGAMLLEHVPWLDSENEVGKQQKAFAHKIEELDPTKGPEAAKIEAERAVSTIREIVNSHVKAREHYNNELSPRTKAWLKSGPKYNTPF